MPQTIALFLFGDMIDKITRVLLIWQSLPTIMVASAIFQGGPHGSLHCWGGLSLCCRSRICQGLPCSWQGKEVSFGRFMVVTGSIPLGQDMCPVGSLEYRNNSKVVLVQITDRLSIVSQIYYIYVYISRSDKKTAASMLHVGWCCAATWLSII